MALNIGKKRKEVAPTDWSEDALLDEAPPDEEAEVPAPVGATTNTTPFDDINGAQKKKPPLKIILAVLGVLILGGGAAAFFMMSGAPEEDEAPPVVMRRPRKPKPAPATKVVVVKPKPGAVTPPGTKTKPVAPGKMGIAQPGAKPPIIKNPVAQAPRMVPGNAVPTPVQPPQGMAGTPGRMGSRDVRIAGIGGASPLQSQLDALWKQGAEAKHRGDNAAARQAWQKILQLSPNHPGIQEAINKLPK